MVTVPCDTVPIILVLLHKGVDFRGVVLGGGEAYSTVGQFRGTELDQLYWFIGWRGCDHRDCSSGGQGEFFFLTGVTWLSC